MSTIDIHSHWYPQEWIRLFEKDGAKESAAIERKDGKYFLKAKQITNVFDERFVVVDERVKAMDERKIDVHALSLTTPTPSARTARRSITSRISAAIRTTPASPWRTSSSAASWTASRSSASTCRTPAAPSPGSSAAGTTAPRCDRS